jgi:hypothetical protein
MTKVIDLALVDLQSGKRLLTLRSEMKEAKEYLGKGEHTFACHPYKNFFNVY